MDGYRVTWLLRFDNPDAVAHSTATVAMLLSVQKYRDLAWSKCSLV
jgi:hypothetical protein